MKLTEDDYVVIQRIERKYEQLGFAPDDDSDVMYLRNRFKGNYQYKHEQEPRRYWSKEELAFLKENSSKMPIVKIAKELDRDANNVGVKRYEMGLPVYKRKAPKPKKPKKTENLWKRWTDKEIESLIKLKSKSSKELAEIFDRTSASINTQLSKLRKAGRF